MPLTREKIFEVLSSVYDPELRRSITDAGLVKKGWINVNEGEKVIYVPWMPTVPGCPMVPHISAAIKAVVEENFPRYSAKVRIREGTPYAGRWNEKLNEEGYLQKLSERLKDGKMWKVLVQSKEA